MEKKKKKTSITATGGAVQAKHYNVIVQSKHENVCELNKLKKRLAQGLSRETEK